MPYTYAIDPDRRLVTATGHGPCDLPSALAMLRRLAADPDFGPGFDVLLDLRGADDTPTAGEARVKAGFFASPAGLGGHRLARVVSWPGDSGAGNQLAALAERYGGEVGTFRSVEEALAWLDRATE